MYCHEKDVVEGSYPVRGSGVQVGGQGVGKIGGFFFISGCKYSSG